MVIIGANMSFLVEWSLKEGQELIVQKKQAIVKDAKQITPTTTFFIESVFNKGVFFEK